MNWKQLGRYLQERDLALSIRCDSSGFCASLWSNQRSLEWVGRGRDLQDAVLNAMERYGLASIAGAA